MTKEMIKAFSVVLENYTMHPCNKNIDWSISVDPLGSEIVKVWDKGMGDGFCSMDMRAFFKWAHAFDCDLMIQTDRRTKIVCAIFS